MATPHVNPLYCLFNVQSFIWIFRMCIVHHHHDRLHDHHQDNYYQDNHRNAYLNPKPLPGWLPSTGQCSIVYRTRTIIIRIIIVKIIIIDIIIPRIIIIKIIIIILISTQSLSLVGCLLLVIIGIWTLADKTFLSGGCHHHHPHHRHHPHYCQS